MAEPAPASRPPLAISRIPLAATWRTPLLAILAVLFSTLLLAACGDEPKLPDAIIDIRAGTVQVKALPDAAYLPAADGQELVQGNEVRAGSSSKIAIIFFDGSVTLLEDGAELRIDRLQGSATSGFSSVELFQAGSRTIHRVQKLVDVDVDAAYVLRTSSSVALVRGTGFIVEDDPVTGTKLKSFEGRVGLAGESGVEVAVVAGESSTTPVGLAIPTAFGKIRRAPRPSRRGPPGGGSSVGRALAFQAGCRGFEPRPPLRLPGQPI